MSLRRFLRNGEPVVLTWPLFLWGYVVPMLLIAGTHAAEFGSNLTESAVTATLFFGLLLSGFVLARLYERARQRGERHRLKTELAAAKLLLREHGIPFGDEHTGGD